MKREDFREKCVQRDEGECVVPWCEEEVTQDPDGPGEVHHILERSLWGKGGYIPENGVSLCNKHHRLSEKNEIPPQAHWRWIEEYPPALPEKVQTKDVDKWGEELKSPPHEDLRDYFKYPSTRHFPFSHPTDRDDTVFKSLESFVDVPLAVTVKMDGSNSMLVRDAENPVRGRNASHADHESFSMLKQLYDEKDVYAKLPEHIQVCGEWLYAKHSIHYGCDCENECEDVGPALESLFQVFGVFDTRYNLWLSWLEVEEWARKLGFKTVPLIKWDLKFENESDVYSLNEVAEKFVEKYGHEGIVARSKFPFHYGHFTEKVGKYVRENHVKTDEHWTRKKLVRNNLKEEE